MKEFKGALISITLAGIIGVGWYKSQKPDDNKERTEQLFSFEKHELTRVEIIQPDKRTIILNEVDGTWSIEGNDYPVSKSMVNRIKHQIHDLSARALVDENPEDLTRYGLGEKGIDVKLTMRDGNVISFVAGDPNPTGVSYYIQPLPGDAVYTVKKSALDYYALDLDAFRERRFAFFNAKETKRIDVTQVGGPDFVLAKNSDRRWELQEPYSMPVDKDMSHRLMGRVSALKARRFVEPDNVDYPKQLLSQSPLLDIRIEQQSLTKVRVRIYETIIDENEALCWVQLNEEPSLYVAPAGIIEEFNLDLNTLKDRQVIGLLQEDIQTVKVVSNPHASDAPEGESSAVFLSGVWSWDDGVPVPGSTPSRLASAISKLKVIDFLESSREDLQLRPEDAPLEILVGEEPNQTVIYIGSKAEPIIDDEGNVYERYTMALNESPDTFLIDVHLRSVAHDFVREYSRRLDNVTEQTERRERLTPME